QLINTNGSWHINGSGK
nr:Chain Y, E2-peptide [Hepacivirus hominis]4HS6_Z Chain Z, E2-peptide [Hepacivirus hominis]4HS8_A Chain A, E2-peptide [Hepacivirus hominis]